MIGLLEKIGASAPANVRLLGLDLGTKTIGLAVSDGAQSIATALRTVERTRFARDMQELEKTVRDYEIGGYVLGWPLNMDGSAGPRCDAVRSFADEMSKQGWISGPVPWIALWDERLSTASVEDFLTGEADMSRARRKQVVDKLAAQHILQGALDFMKKQRRQADQP